MAYKKKEVYKPKPMTEGFISDVTDKILPQIEEWQNRPLDEVYQVIFLIHIERQLIAIRNSIYVIQR